MFINRKQKGYGWYAKVVSKDLTSNEEKTGYINFSFKKDCEPTNLNENGSYVGELYFVDSNNNKRRVFPIVKEYNGQTSIEFKLLETDTDTSKFGKSYVDIKPNDLPFY